MDDYDQRSQFPKQLLDKYQIISQIGQGGFGKVYQARNKLTAEMVAIKVILQFQSELDCETFMEYIHQEIEIMNELDSPYFVKLIESQEDDLQVNLILEYCPYDLFQIWANLFQKKMPEVYLKPIVKQLVNAYQILYEKRIMHRDLKIENVLVALTDQQLENLQKGKLEVLDQVQFKLADFGFSKKQLSISSENMFQTQLGSPFSMGMTLNNNCKKAPEIRQSQEYSFEADVFSLGILIYQLLYNQMPTDSSADLTQSSIQCDFEQKNVVISEQLKSLICQMIQVDCKQRLTWPQIFKYDYFRAEQVKVGKIKPIPFPQFEQEESKQVAIINKPLTESFVILDNRIIDNQFLKSNQDFTELKLKEYQPDVTNDTLIDDLYNYRFKYIKIKEIIDDLIIFDHSQQNILTKSISFVPGQARNISINNEIQYLQTLLRMMHSDLKQKISNCDQTNITQIKHLKQIVLLEDQKSISEQLDYETKTSTKQNVLKLLTKSTAALSRIFSTDDGQELPTEKINSLSEFQSDYKTQLVSLFKKLQGKEQALKDSKIEERFQIQKCMLKMLAIWNCFDEEKQEFNEDLLKDIALEQFKEDPFIVYSVIFKLIECQGINLEE